MVEALRGFAALLHSLDTFEGESSPAYLSGL